MFSQWKVIRANKKYSKKLGWRPRWFGASDFDSHLIHQIKEFQIPDADLRKLPAITSWPEDGGPFLTLPLVHTKSPNKTPDNLGMYRVQIFSDKETGMHFQIGKGGGFHLEESERTNKSLLTNIYFVNHNS